MDVVQQVILGDCREALPSIASDSISACITDPPYNYEFVNHQWDAREIQRRTQRVKSPNSSTLVKNIPYGSGLAGGVRNKRWYERNRQNILDYRKWCEEWGREVFRVLKPGGIIAVFNSTRTAAHVQVALEEAGFYARDCIVYRRHSGIPKGLNLGAKLKQKGFAEHDAWHGWHSCLRNEWEAILVLQKPLEQNYLTTFLNYETGLFYTRNDDESFQSNIIEGIPKTRSDLEAAHCTAKPLKLMEKLVTMFSPPNAKHVVLDPFAGSGTTLLAAQNLGRGFIGIEIVPEYIEVIKRRLSSFGMDFPTVDANANRSVPASAVRGSLPLFE